VALTSPLTPRRENHEHPGIEPNAEERERVQLAILKLSGGDVEKLREQVRIAKEDYRDVLAYAEYPLEMESDTEKMSPGKVEKIRRKDRKQYLEWLKGRPE
jgi:hypothetical protein